MARNGDVFIRCTITLQGPMSSAGPSISKGEGKAISNSTTGHLSLSSRSAWSWQGIAAELVLPGRIAMPASLFQSFNPSHRWHLRE